LPKALSASKLQAEAGGGRVAILILAISIAALVQFALYYWRAMVARVALDPVSDDVLAAAGVSERSVEAEDFAAVARLHESCPSLDNNEGGLGMVGAYYSGVAALAKLGGTIFPSLPAWANREMLLCARYAAVRVEERIHRNSACFAELRS
jgi:hypothetical protein